MDKTTQTKTTQTISRELLERIKKLGRMGDTFESVVQRLVSQVELDIEAGLVEKDE